MSLATGDQLNHYEILAPLGAGGMGEVYRASDLKLKREVAIKVLPAQFAVDSGRLLRFQREAQVLASLNHPNIAAIYGLEHARSIHFLVMELVEGDTIADRLSSKRMEVSEALRFAVQIADATQSAHDKGIIHRDLKPANVKITPDGRIKVLDFGLAKALGDADPAVLADPSNSPTITGDDTRAGVVLGTAAYMSPEQANGQPVDKRADIWGFGVLLFEMLCGKRAFHGKSTTHTLLKVLEHEPDWTALPPLPGGVKDLLERCLQKDPQNRLRDIGDIRVQLQSAITKPVSIQKRRDVRAPRMWVWASVAAAGILAASGYVYLRPGPATALEPMRFVIERSSDTTPSPFVSVSPDGTKIAFIGTASGSPPQIFVRPLRSLDARPLDGTANVQGIPFWTHDSRFLVFASAGKLRKIEASGGPAQFIADAFTTGGGFSTPDGYFVYGRPVNGVAMITASGGTGSPLGDSPILRSANFPAPLPNEHEFLITLGVGAQSGAMPGIYVASLKGGEPRRILPDISRAVYAPSPDARLGYILFVRGSNLGTSGTLMAQPVDARNLSLAGDAIPIAENVSAQGFSASNTGGVLVHGTGGSAVPIGVPGQVVGRMTWLDRKGNILSTFGESGVYRIPAISPKDEKYVALETYKPEGAYLQIFDLGRDIGTRFTFDGNAFDPVWSPDGDRLAYARMGTTTGNGWFVKNADRSGQENLVFTPPKLMMTPHSWSPDGRFLLGNDSYAPADIHALDLSSESKDRQLIPVTETPQINDVHGRFSPDGTWIAYQSTESGAGEIHVRSWDVKAGRPGLGGSAQVSKAGARAGGAVWRRDGKELFYIRPDMMMMAVDVTPGATFSSDTPRELFKITAPTVFFFDVSADGNRFVMPIPEKPVAMMLPFTVVTNWTSTIKK